MLRIYYIFNRLQKSIHFHLQCYCNSLKCFSNNGVEHSAYFRLNLELPIHWPNKRVHILPIAIEAER